MNEYERFKRALDVGRHPGFVGRASYSSCANNGGALAFVYEDMDVGVALVNPRRNTAMATNVHPDHRGHGLGSAIVRYTACNWKRVIEAKVPFFERLGYVPVGALKKGISLNTQVMVREDLFDLAGKLRRIYTRKAE